jgi:hypothetical protein
MRYYLLAAALAVGAAMPQTLSAQHDSANAGHDHHRMMMMMERHHSAGAVDSLISFRDSLQLTDRQVERLVQLREEARHSEHHSMMGGGDGMMQKGGDAMSHRRWARVRFDGFPGKMVPRGRRGGGECCPSCPLMVLSKTQRERAHELLGHDHEG